MNQKGRLSAWSDEKGFGFITPEAGVLVLGFFALLAGFFYQHCKPGVFYCQSRLEGWPNRFRHQPQLIKYPGSIKVSLTDEGNGMGAVNARAAGARNSHWPEYEAFRPPGFRDQPPSVERTVILPVRAGKRS